MLSISIRRKHEYRIRNAIVRAVLENRVVETPSRSRGGLEQLVLAISPRCGLGYSVTGSSARAPTSGKFDQSPWLTSAAPQFPTAGKARKTPFPEFPLPCGFAG